jgi:hypothetical protein
MLRTKRGDVAGYASELLMVPELKLGIVVLASEVEHAQATAQTLTNILVPAFDAALRVLEAEVDMGQAGGEGANATLPGGLEVFIGNYTAASDTASNTASASTANGEDVRVELRLLKSDVAGRWWQRWQQQCAPDGWY